MQLGKSGRFKHNFGLVEALKKLFFVRLNLGGQTECIFSGILNRTPTVSKIERLFSLANFFQGHYS